eukprot:jgi/Mesen1/8001/ME000425S07196
MASYQSDPTLAGDKRQQGTSDTGSQQSGSTAPTDQGGESGKEPKDKELTEESIISEKELERSASGKPGDSLDRAGIKGDWLFEAKGSQSAEINKISPTPGTGLTGPDTGILQTGQPYVA